MVVRIGVCLLLSADCSLQIAQQANVSAARCFNRSRSRSVAAMHLALLSGAPAILVRSLGGHALFVPVWTTRMVAAVASIPTVEIW